RRLRTTSAIWRTIAYRKQRVCREVPSMQKKWKVLLAVCLVAGLLFSAAGVLASPDAAGVAAQPTKKNGGNGNGNGNGNGHGHGNPNAARTPGPPPWAGGPNNGGDDDDGNGNGNGPGNSNRPSWAPGPPPWAGGPNNGDGEGGANGKTKVHYQGIITAIGSDS